MGVELTIDQLAQRTGATSRNIRAYQERGLLPPPRLVGRTGFYDEGHIARLHHIAQLTERGFSLASVRELFEAWESGYGLAHVLGFEQALDTLWHDDGPRMYTREQLAEEFEIDSDETLEGSVALGLLVPQDGRYLATSPRTLRVGRALREAGLPAEALLAEAPLFAADLDRIAQRWVALFLDHVWRPYVESGMPPGELPRITEALRRLPPLALASIEPVFARVMEQRVAEAAAEALAVAPTVTGE